MLFTGEVGAAPGAGRTGSVAERLVSNKSGILLIGSPMCSALSQLQSLNRHRMGDGKFEELLEKGLEHLRFCFKFYWMQMDNVKRTSCWSEELKNHWYSGC